MSRQLREVVFVDGVRTPFGKAKGQYAETRADDLVIKCIRDLLRRNPSLPPGRVDEVAVYSAALSTIRTSTRSPRPEWGRRCGRRSWGWRSFWGSGRRDRRYVTIIRMKEPGNSAASRRLRSERYQHLGSQALLDAINRACEGDGPSSIDAKGPLSGDITARGGVAWAAGTNDVVWIQPRSNGS